MSQVQEKRTSEPQEENPPTKKDISKVPHEEEVPYVPPDPYIPFGVVSPEIGGRFPTRFPFVQAPSKKRVVKHNVNVEEVTPESDKSEKPDNLLPPAMRFNVEKGLQRIPLDDETLEQYKATSSKNLPRKYKNKLATHGGIYAGFKIEETPFIRTDPRPARKQSLNDKYNAILTKMVKSWLKSLRLYIIKKLKLKIKPRRPRRRKPPKKPTKPVPQVDELFSDSSEPSSLTSSSA